MKTTIERLEGDKLRLDVEVDGEAMQAATEATIRRLAQEVRLPGFRPGKVPPKAIVARLGKEAVLNETIRGHLGEWYMSAIASSGIRPIDEPEIDVTEPSAESATEDGAQIVRFSATVPVAPKPKLPDLATLEVERYELPNMDELVGEALRATAVGAGELKPTGKGAAPGDEVVVDFRCIVDGDEVRGASAIGYQARLGANRLLDEIEAALMGHSAGEQLKVPVSFPDDHPMANVAGTDAEFIVDLREVMELEIPDVDDAVAAKVSEFASAAELRADLEASISKRFDGEIDQAFRTAAIGALAEASEVSLPDILVDRRVNELYSNMRSTLQQSGMTIEAFLDRTSRSQGDMFDELKGQAVSDVQRELCIEALAEDANVKIHDDDVRDEIAKHLASARDQGETGLPVDVDEAFSRIVASGQLDTLRAQLLAERSIDHLVGAVKPKLVPFPDRNADAAASETEKTEAAE